MDKSDRFKKYKIQQNSNFMNLKYGFFKQDICKSCISESLIEFVYLYLLVFDNFIFRKNLEY